MKNKELSDMELGKRLAELCGINVTEERKEVNKDIWCIYTHRGFISTSIFCHSLDKIAEIEQIVIEKGLGGQYGGRLSERIELYCKYEVVHYGLDKLITATARQKAEVLYEVLSENQRDE